MSYKALLLKPETHDRLREHGAGDGKTFNFVVNEALDALDEKEKGIVEKLNNG